jgi:hypothetical protein
MKNLSKARFRVKRETERESAIAYFLSPDFVKPYGADAWRYFPRPTMGPGDLRASLLHAADYLDASLDAQIEGDDAMVRDALEVTAPWSTWRYPNFTRPQAKIECSSDYYLERAEDWQGRAYRLLRRYVAFWHET